jgi:DNA-binding Xre family transcriptional regulator
VSSSAIAKAVRNENVNTGVLLKICEVLNCNISDNVDAAATDNAEPQAEGQ